MVGVPHLKARIEHVSVPVPPPSMTKNEQFESGYTSINSDSDDSSKEQRAHTAKPPKHRRQTHAPIVSIARSKSALRGAHQHHSIEPKQVSPLNFDQSNNNHRLRTTRTLISIDTTPFQKFTPNLKILKVLEDFTFYLSSRNYCPYRYAIIQLANHFLPDMPKRRLNRAANFILPKKNGTML